VLLDPECMNGKKIFGQIVCCFRYGREEDEVMGLNFQKDLYFCSQQIYPPVKTDENQTKLQASEIMFFISVVFLFRMFFNFFRSD